jgi:hypothetical protein
VSPSLTTPTRHFRNRDACSPSISSRNWRTDSGLGGRCISAGRHGSHPQWPGVAPLDEFGPAPPQVLGHGPNGSRYRTDRGLMGHDERSGRRTDSSDSLFKPAVGAGPHRLCGSRPRRHAQRPSSLEERTCPLSNCISLNTDLFPRCLRTMDHFGALPRKVLSVHAIALLFQTSLSDCFCMPVACGSVRSWCGKFSKSAMTPEDWGGSLDHSRRRRCAVRVWMRDRLRVRQRLQPTATSVAWVYEAHAGRPLGTDNEAAGEVLDAGLNGRPSPTGLGVR